jgi:cyanamide hydratase
VFKVWYHIAYSSTYAITATAIIQQQFPEYASTFSPSTLAITCLLHDIGTAQENIAATRMSFEFYGGFKALHVLRDFGASQDQADAVCEAIIRHQDLGSDGNITFLGQVIQLATIYDNVSDHPHLPDIKDLVHIETRESAIEAFPRTGWLGCFAKTVEKEVDLKPWCHTTHIPQFGEKILGNKLMRQYE